MCAVRGRMDLRTHDTIAQNETSYLFFLEESHGYDPFTYCIMSYYWAWNGVNAWCSSCENTIDDNITP
jgi:hypothetical protein